MKRREFLKLAGLSAAAVIFGGIAAPGDATPTLPNATGKTIATSGWSTIDPLSESLAVGDVFTIQGYYALNPVTQKRTKHLRQFVISAIHENGADYVPFTPDGRIGFDKINKLGVS